MAISPDAAHVLTGSYDDTVRLWDLSSGKCLDVYEGHAGGVNSVMWLRGGKYALSSSDDGTVRLWDVSMGECVWVLEGMGGRMNTISVDRSGRYVVLGGWRLEMWELDCDIATQLEDKDPLDE